MKKVLFCATVDSHILQFHIPYLKMFKEQGYEVHVATNGNEEIPFCDVKHVVSFERSPIKINNLKAIKQLKEIINKEEFNIIHCHTPMGSVVTRIAAMKARKKLNIKVIYTAHGFHFFKGAPKLNWLIFYPIEKWLAKYTDVLITINNEDYNRATKKFKCKNIKLVPGVGINNDKFDFEMSEQEKKALRKEIGVNENDFVIIYVAELIKRKNQTMAIKAIKQLSEKYDNIKLILPGKDTINGEYQKLAKQLQIEDKVKFLGYRNDIPQLMKISNLSISTARFEGIPVNVLEALYIELPVVVTNCRGNRDLVQDGQSGYVVEIDNVEEMTHKIETIYNNQNEEFKINIKKYELNEVMKKMKEIYNEVEKQKVLIIPTCTDLNRGDQALVLETKKIIDRKYENPDVYMMSTGETIQCEKLGLGKFEDVLKHPGRFNKKNNSNISYGLMLKIKWGIVAILDLIVSILLLNKVTRKIVYPFLGSETKKSINLYKQAVACYVKGGGFLHDYSGGIVGWYTMWFQTYHIRLAIAMKKKVYIMPNSYGPFKSKKTSKMLNKILNKCDFISSRESISATDETNGLGRNIPLYPDLAFYLDKTDKETIQTYLKEKYDIDSSKNKYVAITVRPYRFYSYENPEEKYEKYKKSFVQFIEYLNENKFTPILVVHTRAENEHENDEHCINEIVEMLENKNGVKIIKDDNLNCYDLKAIYGECTYVIGTRFHSVIFSLEQLIPCIAVTYGGNKGDGIMKDMELSEYAIKIGDLTFEELKNKFEQLIENKESVKEQISNYLQHTKIKYEELLDNIK